MQAKAFCQQEHGHERRDVAAQRAQRCATEGLPQRAAPPSRSRIPQVEAAGAAAEADAAAIIFAVARTAAFVVQARRDAGYSGAAAHAAARADRSRVPLETSAPDAFVERIAIDAAC